MVKLNPIMAKLNSNMMKSNSIMAKSNPIMAKLLRFSTFLQQLCQSANEHLIRLNLPN